MLVPEKHDVLAVFAAFAVDGPAPWPYSAYDVAAQIAAARNLTTRPVSQWTSPPPVSVATVQALLSDLAAEGLLTARTCGRWRRLGIGLVLDRRNEVSEPVSGDTIMYGRPQDEQAWHEQVNAEVRRLRRHQAEQIALAALRDRYPDEYAGLVAATERELEQAWQASQPPQDPETKQGGF